MKYREFLDQNHLVCMKRDEARWWREWELSKDREFESLVRSMRHAQAEYFQSRTGFWLRKAKHLEAQVDEHLRERADGQGHLFGQEEG